MRVREPPLVAQPAAVDLRMVAAQDALDLPFADRRRDVASDGASGADGRNFLDLPRARLKPIERGRQSADWAELYDVPGERRSVWLVLECGDLRARAAVSRDEQAVL